MESLNLPEGFLLEDNIIHGITQDGLLHVKLHRPEKKNAMTF